MEEFDTKVNANENGDKAPITGINLWLNKWLDRIKEKMVDYIYMFGKILLIVGLVFTAILAVAAAAAVNNFLMVFPVILLGILASFLLVFPFIALGYHFELMEKQLETQLTIEKQIHHSNNQNEKTAKKTVAVKKAGLKSTEI